MAQQRVRQQILIVRDQGSAGPFKRFGEAQKQLLVRYIEAGYEFVSTTTLVNGALLMLATAPFEVEPPEVDPVDAEAHGIYI